MDTLITIAASAGLIGVTILGLLVGAYGLQTLVRLVRHWDTSAPPPAFRSGRIAGMELELDDPTGSSQNVAQRLEGGLQRLEGRILRLSKRVRTLERNLFPKTDDDPT